MLACALCAVFCRHDQRTTIPRGVHHGDVPLFYVGLHHRLGGCPDSAAEGCVRADLSAGGSRPIRMVHSVWRHLDSGWPTDQANRLQEWHSGRLVVGRLGVPHLLSSGVHAGLRVVSAGPVCRGVGHHGSSGGRQPVHRCSWPGGGGLKSPQFGAGLQFSGHHHCPHHQRHLLAVRHRHDGRRAGRAD